MSLFDFARVKFVNDLGQVLARRSKIRFHGADVADDAIAGETVITSGTISRLTVPTSGTIHDLDTQNCTMLEFTAPGAKSVTGVGPRKTGTWFVNRSTTGDLTLANDIGSAAPNRFLHILGADLVVPPGSMALVWYDYTLGINLAVVMGGASSTPGVTPTLYGLDGFDSTNRLGTAAGEGIRGSTSSFWVCVPTVVKAQTGAADRRLAMVTTFAGTGWTLGTSLTNTRISGAIYRVGPAAVNSPLYTVVPGDLGKLLLPMLVYDAPANLLRLYVKGVEVGGGTAVSSAYAPPAGSLRMTVGEQVAGGAPADQNQIFGVCGGDGFLPTAGEIATHFAAAQANLAANLPLLPLIPGKTTYRNNFGSPWTGTYVPTEGTGDLVMYNGASSGLDLVTLSSPEWA